MSSPTPIATFVVFDSGINPDEVSRFLPASPEIAVVGVAEGLESAWVSLHETTNDLLIVVIAGQSDGVLTLIDAAVKERPRRPVVVVAYSSSESFTRRVFAAGADDLVMLPAAPDDVLFALQKAIARKEGGSESTGVSRAPLICVLGPKGGTGKTLTATSTAVALSELGKSVALVDLDLQFGDVGLCLGVTPERTIFDLVRTGGSLDDDKVNGFLMTHEPSGIRLLLAPSRPDQAAVVSVEFLRDVYSVLRTMVDYVVVDTPPGFTPEVIATIDSATAICMVGMLDVLSLKNTKLGLETLDLMGFPGDRVTLVLNRAGTRVGISNEDVEAIVGRAPEVLIPSDRDIPRAVNEGRSILESKSQSEAAKAFRTLAGKLVGIDREGGQVSPRVARRGLRRRVGLTA